MVIDTSIVRIYRADKFVVGAGFLVDERHVFTCAHVVTEALGLPEDAPEVPQEQLLLDFPLVAPKKLLPAKTVCWQPRQEDESGDIAVLQLESDPPEGTEAACFAQAEDFWNHPFRAFGFPNGQDDGVWATGQLLGKTATNWIMIEDMKAQGFAVMQGFSGGPVWDTQLEGIVGMVVAATRPTTIDTKTAFAIPPNVLTTAWHIDSPALNQRIFLSSAPGDAAFAEQLSADLHEQGIVVWNEQKGPDGAPAREGEQLQRAIRAAQAVVLVVSPQTRASRTVKEHLRLADLYRRKIILVWVGDDPEAKPQRYGWSETTWIDVHEATYPSTLETIEASLSQNRLTSITALLGPSDDKPQPEPRNPYKGLHVFTADDTKDFFGRDRLVNELVKDVQGLLAAEQVTPEQGRLLALIGPSGSGKSSVLLAGLLPKLQHDAVSGSAKWLYLEPMVPGKRPLEALTSLLKPYFPESSNKTLREDLDDDTTRGLHLLATQLVKKSDNKVVLLVDQFEELFTQTESETERQQFVELLLTAATEPHGPVVILLTIRADFYDRPMQYPALNRLLQAHLRQVLPMDVEDLRATIEQPAALPDVQLTFEGNLVGDLLFEIQGQVGALPLLQFTLEQLFQHRRGHRLTLQAYHDIGGVRGALAQHAEKTYKSLPSEEHRRLARALFLRLIEPGATEQDTTRRRAALTEFVLDNAKQTLVMNETIDAFIAARLLMTNDIAGVKTIEVSHEAVIREWPLLASWLKEAREDIPLQQAVSDDAEEWVRHGKPKDRLYRGTQLEEAKVWATHYMASESEIDFLQAGGRQQQRSFQLRVAVIFLILLLVIPVGILGVPQLISFAQQINLIPITVTSLSDDGPGSLRVAIGDARPNSTIHFSDSLKGKTIVLTNNLVFDKSFTLIGPDVTSGPGVAISSGKHDYQILVDAGIRVTIDGLAFKNGVLTNSDFIRNSSGYLKLNHIIISDNSILGIHKALIYNNKGRLDISNSMITNNTGEIYNTGGQMTIIKSTIKNMNRSNPDKTIYNTPPPIYNENDGSLTIQDSTIADNISYYNGGGIFNGGQLTISDSTISGNGFISTPGSPTGTKNGGGIANDVGATLTVTNSTIAGNTAGYSGGGIANLSDMVIINSTIAGNTAGNSGGGIVNLHGSGTTDPPSQTVVSFCTIYGNSANAGAGIATLTGTVTMSNSIVIGNNLVSGGPPSRSKISGELISKGYNLIQNMANTAPQHTSASGASNIAVSRFTPYKETDKAISVDNVPKIFDPQGLQNNGGQTKTYKLLSGQGNPANLAVDAVPHTGCLITVQDASGQNMTISTDQRGKPRPDDNEQSCDIGAYETSG